MSNKRKCELNNINPFAINGHSASHKISDNTNLN